MFTVNEIQGFVNQGIQNLIANYSENKLHQPVEYALSGGGKRLRPILCLMTYNVFSDTLPTSVLHPALGLEVYHNFTLVHDDVMDRSEWRRSRPTVHKKWDVNTAILAGDAMYVLAYKYMAQCPPQVLVRVIEAFNKAADWVCEGQQMDMHYEKQSFVTEADYIDMISRKTGALLAFSFQLGGLCAGASDSVVQHLYKTGMALGIAFQIRDDYLDVFGRTEVLGKNTGSDIENNKKTWLLNYATHHAQGKDKAILNQLLSAENTPERTACITTLFETMGVKEKAEERIAAYMEEALAGLDHPDIPRPRIAALAEFMQQLSVREK
ncbi:MAG: polyprenyl synthetase family protein [Bacteroidales bacterium]|jgi:geranylgeranyl diphosphate synthase type II